MKVQSGIQIESDVQLKSHTPDKKIIWETTGSLLIWKKEEKSGNVNVKAKNSIFYLYFIGRQPDS